MPERERPEPFDVSEQFVKYKKNLKVFREFLKSLQGAPVSIAIDLADAPPYNELTNFLLAARPQIESFTIRATEEEKKLRQGIFLISGIKWERIE